VVVAWLYLSPLRMAQLITTCKNKFNLDTDALKFHLNATKKKLQRGNLKLLHQVGKIIVYLEVLQLSAYDPKAVVDLVVVYVDFGEARGGARRHPPLDGVLVDHHRSPCRRNTLLTAKNKQQNP